MFLTSKIKKTFIKFRQVFIKALILNYFDLKHHIQIKTNIFKYIISEIFNQLTSDDLSQYDLVVFFSKR